MHIVCTPLSAGGRGLNLQPNFQKGEGGGRLDRTSTFRGGCWERGGDFFSEGGGCNFHIKNKSKSEIFNEKKKFISKNSFLS